MSIYAIRPDLGPRIHSLRPHPCPRRRVAQTAWPTRLVIAPGHPVWQLLIEPQGRGGRRRSPKRGAALRSLRSGHGSASWKSGSRGKGKFAEFIRETAEQARSVRFRQVTGTGVRDDGLIRSRIHGDTGLRGAAFGGPPVGQGDPGVKPGAFLPGPPLFFRSRREDHGPNGCGLNGYVWVLGPELPGLAGGRIALGSKAKGQGGDGAPPRRRRPTVVDGLGMGLGDGR